MQQAVEANKANVPSQNIAGQALDMSPLGGPRFMVTVDTEEEFDWNAPFSRDGYGLSHIPAITRFQKQCESRNVKPAYLIDWAIVQDAPAVELLKSFLDAGAASIGVQLHPWVNPPHDEEVTSHNSYACNLPPELERAKLTNLNNAIVRNFDVQPDIYRAGRYGAGPATPQILKDLGIRIDTSVRSRFDYRPQGGPDHSKKPLHPYWIDGAVVELPVTTVFAGGLRGAGDTLFSRMFASQMSRSIMARAGLVERIALTPEGIPLESAITGIDRALEENIPVLNFSVHSPSFAVGHTPYVRNEADLEALYAWWEGVYAHLDTRGVKPVSVEEIASLTGD